MCIFTHTSLKRYRAGRCVHKNIWPIPKLPKPSKDIPTPKDLQQAILPNTSPKDPRGVLFGGDIQTPSQDIQILPNTPKTFQSPKDIHKPHRPPNTHIPPHLSQRPWGGGGGPSKNQLGKVFGRMGVWKPLGFWEVFGVLGVLGWASPPPPWLLLWLWLLLLLVVVMILVVMVVVIIILGGVVESTGPSKKLILPQTSAKDPGVEGDAPLLPWILLFLNKYYCWATSTTPPLWIRAQNDQPVRITRTKRWLPNGMVFGCTHFARKKHAIRTSACHWPQAEVDFDCQKIESGAHRFVRPKSTLAIQIRTIRTSACHWPRAEVDFDCQKI